MQPVARIEGDKLIVTIQLEAEPKPSASGKTLVVATTRGNQNSGLTHKTLKKPIIIGLNAYVENDAAPIMEPAVEAAPAEASKKK